MLRLLSLALQGLQDRRALHLPLRDQQAQQAPPVPPGRPQRWLVLPALLDLPAQQVRLASRVRLDRKAACLTIGAAIP